MEQITDMQRKMYTAHGHNVRVKVIDIESPFVGTCSFVSALDNEPDGAAIYIRVPGQSGMFEFMEEEIESIQILN